MTYIKSKIIFSTIASMLVLSIFSVFLSVGTCEAEGENSIYVDDDGADYTKIQDAVDNASERDTIYVHSGIYKENVVINKQLTLIGLNNPVIYNDTTGHTISINADFVSIKGFIVVRTTVEGGYVAGIYIISNNNITISDCIIRDHDYAIYLLYYRRSLYGT